MVGRDRVHTTFTRTVKSETGAGTAHRQNVSVVRRTSSVRLPHSMRAVCALRTIKPRSLLVKYCALLG